MKAMIVLLALLTVSFSARAEDTGDDVAVKNCLSNWRTNPFKGDKPEFRVIVSKVKVMGIGPDITDSTPTKAPELVLIKPNVTVMAKTALHLMNPNGWYCLKASVAVLGKNAIDLACKAHLAFSNDGTTVMGDSNAKGGVTVLGGTQVNQVCN
jgi:hypothetical protein